MNTTTTSHTSGVKATEPFNWIPAVWQYTGLDGVTHTAAQLNGDGTLYFNEEWVRRLCEMHPAVPGENVEWVWLHAILAIHDGRMADAPRDFQHKPALSVVGEQGGQG